MDEEKILEFCLDWQMNHISKKELCNDFVLGGWSFSAFKEFAEKRNWFVNSMYALLYAEEFSK